MEELKIVDIIKDIQSGIFDHKQIMLKYGLSRYRYDHILKKYEIKNPIVKRGGKVGAPKQTKFKQLLNQDENGDKNIENISFDLEKFQEDCKAGMKIIELMEKYSLSLYQVRELRKKYELKTK
jgi:hypothetical protein